MITIDDLEIDYGRAILCELTGQDLTRNRQSVRLLDQTRHSSEYFFRSDEQGKPYIQNFAEGKRYYPITAYCLIHQVDYSTAIHELRQQYGLYDRHRSVAHPQRPKPQRQSKPISIAIDELPLSIYEQSLAQPERNGFYQYLSGFLGEDRASELFGRYRLGTSRRWLYEGMLATCFPQFDSKDKLRQIKVIPFHPLTGRRAKADQDARLWNQRRKRYEVDTGEKVWFAGKALAGDHKLNLQQCYFGEHLLAMYPQKTVALVEGESTAVVCSAIWSDYVWLATGGSTGGRWYDPERFAVFQNRKVVLWPDSEKFADWSQKAKALYGIASSLVISRYVEDNAPAGVGNVDLRDLLTWPRYTPREGKPIFGEVLPVKGNSTVYPAYEARILNLTR
ncbi:DUF6371 domain-containing protein [Spirosoma sp. SC4-14]|uniref:DUF6371 domain-containing protein n=1 Tax=Spirosoma sp. SC4-14 TaxID=3128900 RepID=UPI0030D2F6BD